MKRIYIITLTMSLLTAGTLLFAQFRTPLPASNPLKPVGINLSLWKGLSTQPTDSVGSTAFNLGIFSSQNNLTGVGINLLGSVTKRDVKGLQLSGLSNTVGQQMKGLQLAGITNINDYGYQGVSIAGLVGINGDEGKGLLASGLANVTGNDNCGLTLAGLMNFTGNGGIGLLLSGIANITGNGYRGIAASGLMNVSGGSAAGMQVSSLLNLTAEDMAGLQLSTLGNVVGKELKGVQIGLANMAFRGKGLQIGLFNYYKEKFDGLQLGLVNANPHTRTQLLVSGGNTTKSIWQPASRTTGFTPSWEPAPLTSALTTRSPAPCSIGPVPNFLFTSICLSAETWVMPISRHSARTTLPARRAFIPSRHASIWNTD